jgi:hypothetical protein
VESEAFQRIFLTQFEATLTHMAETLEKWPAQRAVTVDMADLSASQATVIREILKRLALPAGQTLDRHLDALPPGARSRHKHRSDDLAIPRPELEQRLLPHYHRLLDLPQRVGVSE